MKYAIYVFILFSLLCCRTKKIEQEKPRLTSFTFSECEGETHLERIQNRISKHKIIDNTSYFRLHRVNNCCGAFDPAIKANGDTIWLSFEQGEKGKEYTIEKTIKVNDSISETITKKVSETIICECDCLFQFDFSLENFTSKDYELYVNGKSYKYSPHKYNLKEIQYDLLNGDTINLTDKYGFRQGYHAYRNDKNQIRTEGFFKDDIFTGVMVRKFDSLGKIMDERYFKNGDAYSWKVYERGKLKKECLLVDYFDVSDICNEYDEDGKLISKQINE